MTELEPPRASAAPHWERVVFAALLVLHLAPIIWLDHFATQDGPAHVANAAIINQRLDRDCPVVSETFGLRIAKFPNVLERVILVAFARALSPTLAEKLLQLAIVASLAIGMRLVIRRIAPANAFLSVGAFSLVYAYPFSMGFYAFSLGLALMSFTFATWLAHREAFSVRWAIGFALLTSATFLAHPLPFVALGVFLGAGALSAAWADRSALGNDDPRRGDFATLVVRRC